MLSMTLGQEAIPSDSSSVAAEIESIVQNIVTRPRGEQVDAIVFVLERIPEQHHELFAKRLFVAGVDAEDVETALVIFRQRRGAQPVIPLWVSFAGAAVGIGLGALVAGRGVKRRVIGGTIGGVVLGGGSFALHMLVRK